MATKLPIQPYLQKDRAVNLTDRESSICHICDGIVWLPKCCQNCDTPYCSPCIKNRQLESSEPIQCPPQTGSESTQLKECSGFTEYRCSNHVLRALSKLVVKCRYEQHGCEQIPPYNHLETHEEICDYQQKTCAGCKKDFALKDFKSHEGTCPLVTLTCAECQTSYSRQDQDQHTETKCLREQLIQVKAVVKTEAKSSQEQFIQMKAIVETETNSLREQLIQLEAVVKTEAMSSQEQFIQMKATAETETNSLREQLQELRTRIGQLENRFVTETVCTTEAAASIPIIEVS